MIKIYIPLSIITVLLKISGALDIMAPFLSPFMEMMGLPGETAITLVAAGTNGIYGGIATLAAFDLTFRQITILGVVLGFSHNLIVETGILMKLKFARIQIAIFRFLFAILTGIILNLVLPDTIQGTIINPYAKLSEDIWISTTKSILATCGQIVGLILILNISYNFAKQWKYSSYLKQRLKFIPNAVGLSENAFVPWIAGSIFGIVYGAGILFRFVENNELSRKDASLITIFLCLCHAIIEDSLLFWVIGGNFWYIFIIRTGLAVVFIKILSYNNLYNKIAWIGLIREKNAV